jgi:hypothetical protein
MTTLFLFCVTAFAKIAGACTEAEGLPIAGKKNVSLKVGSYRLYVGIRLAMYQDRSAINIEDLTHLLRRRRKRRTDEAQAETITSELALQPDPAGCYNF